MNNVWQYFQDATPKSAVCKICSKTVNRCNNTNRFQICSSRLLETDAENDANNLSNGRIEIINGKEYELRFNCSTVELKSKVHYLFHSRMNFLQYI
jgi:hypothetical protein